MAIFFFPVLLFSFGFVTFGDYNDASLAIQAMNGYPYEKNNFKPLQVSFKTSKNK